MGDSHVGRVFQRQELLLCRDLAAERHYPADEQAYADGVRAYVVVPLVVHGRGIEQLKASEP